MNLSNKKTQNYNNRKNSVNSNGVFNRPPVFYGKPLIFSFKFRGIA